MKLSELKTGEKGVIVKVLGHGGFRKRIVEMGFIKGKIVEVLLNAPLQDPVKYKIMGYEVSLRHNEADMIEIISVEEAMLLESNNTRVQSTEKYRRRCLRLLPDRQTAESGSHEKAPHYKRSPRGQP